MTRAAAAATLLLPPRQRLAGQPLPDAVARALGRADALPAGAPGEAVQLQRHFQPLPRGWPVAALTRAQDAADADGAQWLRADPAWVRPDINGARLLAIGEGMQLAREDADALLPALRPLFGDSGFPIDAPVPSRWYLRLPAEARLPGFAPPEQALGTDLFDALVGNDPSQDPLRRRWRTLLSEAQVVLHNHPWNARRAERGVPPVNSLWFWGGGRLPDAVDTPWRQVCSDEVLLRALATRSGAALAPRGTGFDVPAVDLPAVDLLVDLRDARDPARLSAHWLAPAIAALAGGQLGALRLDFADGAGCSLLRKQRWRFWRKPVPGFARVLPRLQAQDQA